MEFLDKIGGTIFGVRRPETKETRWNYNYFREYLLALTKGTQFLLPPEKYPRRIELDQGWHTLLNNMREDTQKDKKERWALIGSKQKNKDKLALYLPRNPSVGQDTHVPLNIVQDQIAKARTFRIENFIGEIHSHPPSIDNIGSFSFGDIRLMVQPTVELVEPRLLLVMGLIDGNDNFFAFRTRATKLTNLDYRFRTPEESDKQWYKQYGFHRVTE